MSAPLLVMAEGLGKRYRIGAPEPPSRGPLRAAGRWLWRPFGRARAVLSGRLAQSSEAELWALRDISLTLSPGEVLGLVGPNGAGKTTLLRLLSGITRPTTGRLGIRGRVGSLLEVSIGFHPELTGRENIYLYGALLGLRRAEVRGRFDDIIAFSGVALMLDTPMKFFSSGMYARLAFAVASSLAPDLLLVDEVLSVSDLAFQQRSLSVIRERARAGAGVVFVSHNRSLIRRLATVIWNVEDGTVEPYRGTLDEYMHSQRLRRDAAGAGGGASAGSNGTHAVAERAAGEAALADDDERARTGRAEERERKRREAELRNQRYRVLGPMQKLVEQLERRITKLEGEQKERGAELSDPAVYADEKRRNGLLRDYQSAAAKLDELTGRWEAAVEELEQAEAELRAAEAAN